MILRQQDHKSEASLRYNEIASRENSEGWKSGSFGRVIGFLACTKSWVQGPAVRKPGMVLHNYGPVILRWESEKRRLQSSRLSLAIQGVRAGIHKTLPHQKMCIGFT